MFEHQESEVLFAEKGASWAWLWAGPAAALAMVLVQYRAGMGFRPVVPLFFLAMTSGFLAVQISAARVHTSIELTSEALREGTEVLPVDEILEVFDEPEYAPKPVGPMQSWRVKPTVPLEKWQTARALGEINGIPRKRTAIGLRLTNGRMAQAWARDPEELRAALTRLVEARTG